LSEPAAPDDGKIVKRSIRIAGHATSISLEEAFWRTLREIAAQRGVSLAQLAAEVDARRGAANLSSALRVFALQALRAQ
jgi:predicted DNA-binding ribbon-helix-helix protein